MQCESFVDVDKKHYTARLLGLWLRFENKNFFGITVKNIKYYILQSSDNCVLRRVTTIPTLMESKPKTFNEYSSMIASGLPWGITSDIVRYLPIKTKIWWWQYRNNMEIDIV